MAKKPTTTKKSLKSLFMRSEAPPKVPVEKEEQSHGGEKKKFKLFKFSLKSRSNSALEKTANDRSTESAIFSDSDQVFLDNGSPASRSKLFASAPRLKKKDLSYSELDLPKAKKSGVFSFSLRKKKRDKDREEMSKSVIGLHGPWTHERRKQHLDLDQWEPRLGARRDAKFAMSQPELDTAEAFDIPLPPPPPATHQLSVSKRSVSDAYLSRRDPPSIREPGTNTLPEHQTLHDRHGRLRSLETLLDSPEAFDVDRGLGQVPIATMPELVLTAPSSPVLPPRRQGPSTTMTRAELVKRLMAGPAKGEDTTSRTPSEARAAVNSPPPFSGSNNVVLSPLVLVQKRVVLQPDLPVANTAGEPPDQGYSSHRTAIAMPTLPATPGSMMDAAAIESLLDHARGYPVGTSSPRSQDDDGSPPNLQDLTGEPGGPSDHQSPASGGGYESVFSQSFTTEVLSAIPETCVPLPPVPVGGGSALPPVGDRERSDPFPESAGDLGVPEPLQPVSGLASDSPVSTDHPLNHAHHRDEDASPMNEDALTDTKHQVLNSLYDSLLPVSLRRSDPPPPGPEPSKGDPRWYHAVATTPSSVPTDPAPSSPESASFSPQKRSPVYSALKPEEPGHAGNTEAPVSPPSPLRHYPGASETGHTQTQDSLVPEGSRLAVVWHSISTSPEPFPAPEAMTALKYQKGPLEIMAALTDQQGTLETMAILKDQQETLETMATLTDQQGPLETMAALKDQQGLLETMAALKDQQGPLETMAALKNQQELLETMAALKDQQGTLETMAASKDQHGSRKAMATLTDQQETLETMATLKDQQGPLRTMATLTDQQGPLETMAALKKQKRPFEIMFTLNGKKGPLETMAALKDQQEPLETMAALKDQQEPLETMAALKDQQEPLETMATLIDQQGPLEIMAAFKEQQGPLGTMAEGEWGEAGEGEQGTQSGAGGHLYLGSCEPFYITVGSDSSSALDVYFSAEEDAATDYDLDEISTLAGSDLGDREDPLWFRTTSQGPDEPPGNMTLMGGEWGESVERVPDRAQGTAARAQSPSLPPSPSPSPIYSTPPPPAGEQQLHQGVGGGREATESWKRRIDMWGERLGTEQQHAGVPVGQVQTLTECEPATPFSQEWEEEEEEEEEGGLGKEDLSAPILPVTGDPPDLPTQVPDPLGREYLPHKVHAQRPVRETHPSLELGNSAALHLSTRVGGETGESVAPPVPGEAHKRGRGSERSLQEDHVGIRVDTLAEIPEALAHCASTNVILQPVVSSSSSSSSLLSVGGAKPPEAIERVGAEQIPYTQTEIRPGEVLRASLLVTEPSNGSGPEAAATTDTQGSRAAPSSPAPQDLCSSSATSGSPLGPGLLHHPHTGPAPPAAEMSSSYSSGVYVAPNGSTPRGGEGDTPSPNPWRNNFNGVSQYRPGSTPSSSTLSSPWYLDTTVPSVQSPSKSFPDASLDTRHLPPASTASSTTYSSASSSTTYSSASSTTSGLQTDGSPDNRRSDRRRVLFVSTISVSSDETEVDAPAAGGGAGGGGGGGAAGRRSWEREEPVAAPVREAEARPEEIKALPDTALPALHRLTSPECDPAAPAPAPAAAADSSQRLRSQEDTDAESLYTGVFTATRVHLITEPSNTPSSSPVTPDADSPYLNDMEVLKDTLKSLGPTAGPVSGAQKQRSLRGVPFGFSSLAPIVEDTPSPTSITMTTSTSATTSQDVPDSSPRMPDSLSGLFARPLDMGLGAGGAKAQRSPLELTKQNQQEPPIQNGSWGLGRPLRASAAGSIVMRQSNEDPSQPAHNGTGPQQYPPGSSRLDHSVLFSGYRPPDAPLDRSAPGSALSPRPLFRTASLPDSAGSSFDRVSKAPRESALFGSTGGEASSPSAYDRFSFLLNSAPNSTPGAGSLTGTEDLYSRISRPSQPFNGGSADFARAAVTFGATGPSTDAPYSVYSQAHGPKGMGPGAGVLGAPLLQRSFSSDSSPAGLFSSVQVGSHFKAPEPAEPEKPMVPKYRAFPDAYLTKEKEHGKLNPRPGKMFIFDRPGMCGQRIEVRSDVADGTSWDLQETISIRVVRGGWVLYEKPNFKGEKLALDEGDLELTFPFMFPEEEEEEVVVEKNGQPNGVKANGEQNGAQNGEQNGEPAEKAKPARKFIIGSLRRTVRDYSVPEISLFPEENAEGKKVTFRDTSEDARIFGFPIRANSIIINAGLWLVYAEPFFQGVPRVLEVGGFPTPASWGVEQPFVASLHPLKIGEPRVESVDEPKMILYDKPYFSGKSRTIHGTIHNFMTRMDNQQTAFMYNAGSIKVLGGIWVGYEKEGFRGHQYLLEEGDYHDWRVWGGCSAEMRSVKVIRADLSEPMLMMFEQPEDEDLEEENSFEVTEAIPDVAIFQYKTTTRSIHVLSGAWVAYSHVDYSGNQYILEKGFYNNCADWGSIDNVICSVQPILPAPTEGPSSRNEVMLYSEATFQGNAETFNLNQKELPNKLLTKSCRLLGGSWILFDAKDYAGNQCVLSEGEYPNLVSMGCPAGFVPRSLKAVPLTFSIPSISLFTLECLEGKEVTTDVEMSDLLAEGFNNHFLSVRVNSGCWVLCEYSNFRGRQFLLEPIEITNWPKFSSLHTVGSMYPVRQRRRFFRIKNKEHGKYMCLSGTIEEMKPGRVVVTTDPETPGNVWYYDYGFLKNKIAPTMCLQVIGDVEPGSKAVLWSETRQPLQNWSIPMKGRIPSLTFTGMVLDVKGGKTYDKDYLVILPQDEERESQQWSLELL